MGALLVGIHVAHQCYPSDNDTRLQKTLAEKLVPFDFHYVHRLDCSCVLHRWMGHNDYW